MFLLGIGMVLQLNSTVNLTNDWFSASERVFMTSVSLIFNFGGIAVGFLLPNIWVDGEEKDMKVARQ